MLAEQEQQAAGSPVGEVKGRVVQKAVNEFPSLAGVGRGACFALRPGDLQGQAVLAGGGPGQEVPDVVGGRAGGQPGLHVALTAGGQGEAVPAEPGQEGDHGQDLVPGAAGDDTGAGAGLGPAPQAPQDLPGQVGLDEPPVGRLADGVEHFTAP